VGLKSLKSLNLTNGYPNKKKNNNNNTKNNNKVKSKPLQLRSRVKRYCKGGRAGGPVINRQHHFKMHNFLNGALKKCYRNIPRNPPKNVGMKPPIPPHLTPSTSRPGT
jgi:hypothetical protein